MDEDTWILKK
jgi:chromosome segregation ATPase